MSYRKISLLCSLSLVFLVFHKTFGDETDRHDLAAPCTDGTQCTAARSKEVGKRFRDKEQDVLAVVTGLPKTSLRKSYGKSLPPALDKAQKGDLGILKDVLADVFGRINSKQRKQLEAEATKDIPDGKLAELRKAAGTDARAKTLVDNILLGIKAIDHKAECAKDDKCTSLSKMLIPAYEKELRENDNFYIDMRIAALGKKKVDGKEVDATKEERAAARDRILKNYDRDSLLAWWEGQKASGNKVVEGQFLKALFQDGKLDVVSKDKGKERILAPEDKLDEVVSNFSKARGGLETVSVAAEPHKDSEIANYFPAEPVDLHDGSDKEKTVATGCPGDVCGGSEGKEKERPTGEAPTDTATGTRGGTTATGDRTTGTGGTSTTGGTTTTGGGTTTTGGGATTLTTAPPAPTNREIYAIFKTNCAQCHGDPSKSAHKNEDLKDIRMNANGELLGPPASAAQAILGAATGPTPSMPPFGPPLTAEQKNLIALWARANGAH